MAVLGVEARGWTKPLLRPPRRRTAWPRTADCTRVAARARASSSTVAPSSSSVLALGLGGSPLGRVLTTLLRTVLPRICAWILVAALTSTAAVSSDAALLVVVPLGSVKFSSVPGGGMRGVLVFEADQGELLP